MLKADGGEFEPVQQSDARQNLRRIRPLSPPRLEQLTLLRQTQDALQKQPGRRLIEQTLSKLAQDRMVKAFVVQFEREQIFPIQAPARLFLERVLSLAQ